MPNFAGKITHAASGKRVSFFGSWTIQGSLAQWEASVAPDGEPSFILRGHRRHQRTGRRSDERR